MRVAGKYILMTKIKEVEHIGNSALVFSESETGAMAVQKGTVVDFGPDIEGLKPGETCYYNKGRAFDVRVDGVTYTMVQEVDTVLYL